MEDREEYDRAKREAYERAYNDNTEHPERWYDETPSERHGLDIAPVSSHRRSPVAKAKIKARNRAANKAARKARRK